VRDAVAPGINEIFELAIPTEPLAYQRAQLDLLRDGVAMLHWASRPDDHKNGSIFFVDPGTGSFAVTAHHVYEKYIADVTAKSVRCQIGDVAFDPSERLISESHEYDVATFRITAEELRMIGKTTIPWPPAIPAVGDLVMIAGFPGPEKKPSASTNSLDVRLHAAKWNVSSVRDRGISLVRPADALVLDVNGRGFPEREYDFGGMSGGPVVAFFDQGPVSSWAFSGVIYEFHQGWKLLWPPAAI